MIEKYTPGTGLAALRERAVNLRAMAAGHRKEASRMRDRVEESDIQADNLIAEAAEIEGILDGKVS